MNHTKLRGCALLLLLGIGVFGVRPAHADISCVIPPTMSDLSFGSVDPQSTQTDATATFNATCSNSGALTWTATICLSIGAPAVGTGFSRQLQNGTATLAYQLYQDPSRTIIWGSQFSDPPAPLQFDISIPPRTTIQVPATLFGRVFAGQTSVIPGTYTQAFIAGDTRMTINPSIAGGSPPGKCNPSPLQNRQFPFVVSAKVINKCTFSASPLDFGTNPGLLNTSVDASTTLGVQCSVGTAYNVGLNAGQNGGGDIGARKMVLGGNSVGYQLYRDTGRTQVWGNTIGTNTVAGTGNGNTQYLTVYGSVPPQTTPPAGTYNDVVIVTVTY